MLRPPSPVRCQGPKGAPSQSPGRAHRWGEDVQLDPAALPTACLPEVSWAPQQAVYLPSPSSTQGRSLARKELLRTRPRQLQGRKGAELGNPCSTANPSSDVSQATPLSHSQAPLSKCHPLPAGQELPGTGQRAENGPCFQLQGPRLHPSSFSGQGLAGSRSIPRAIGPASPRPGKSQSVLWSPTAPEAVSNQVPRAQTTSSYLTRGEAR